jgi:hypothetical protein
MLVEMGFSRIEFVPSPLTPHVRVDASVVTEHRKRQRRIRAALAAWRKPADGRVFVRAWRHP